MTIVRASRPDRAFLVVSNAVLQDTRLSMRALGLLVRLLSRPDGWRTNSETLAEEFGCGRDQMRGVLSELAKAGYMRLRKMRAPDGTLASRWFVFDEPQPADSEQPEDRPAPDSPAPENPCSGGPGPLEKTDEENTNNHPLPFPMVREELRLIGAAADRTNAKTFHASVLAGIRAKGWVAGAEHFVADRGDGQRGRVDILVTSPCVIGIELDNVTPRRKSIEKLSHIDGYRVVMLRGSSVDLSAAGLDAALGCAEEGRGSIPAPISRLVDAYHAELCGEAVTSGSRLPAVRVMDPKRERALRSFWKFVMTSTREDGTRRATTEDEGVAWAHSYFAAVRDNDFIMGRTQRSAAHQNWRPDIEYVVSERGMKQILERT